MQVQCGTVSYCLSEFSPKKPDVRHQTGRNAQRCCQQMEKIRSLPGLSHVTYSWVHRGCHRSFLEISYSTIPTNGDCNSRCRSKESSPCRSCSTVVKSGTADNGHVPREQYNKWPEHNSLTLVCDSRPSHSNGHCHLRSRSNERLPTCPCRSCSTVEKSGMADKGHVPQERCNKWPIHNSLTLVCDSRPSLTPARVRITRNIQLLQNNSSATTTAISRIQQD